MREGKWRATRAETLPMRLTLIIAILVFGAALVFGYDVLRPAQIIDRDALLAIPAGGMKPVSDIANADFTRACVLQPYQNRMQEENGDLDLVRANAHLSAIEYEGDERHWALILIADTAIELVVFNRSSELDLMVVHQLQSTETAKLLPVGFVPVYCAAGNRAALSKIGYRERTYVVLGEAS